MSSTSDLIRVISGLLVDSYSISMFNHPISHITGVVLDKVLVTYGYVYIVSSAVKELGDQYVGL